MRTSRSRDGKFTKSSTEALEVYPNEGFARPKSRRSTEIATQPRRWFSLASIFPTQNSQARDPKGIATRVYTFASIFSWVVAALRITTKVLLWVIAFFLLKGLLLDDVISKFWIALSLCCDDTTDNSCTRIFLGSFFPAANYESQPWLIFRITNRGSRYDAYFLYQLEFPLFCSSFGFLFLVEIALLIGHWLLGHMHSFLVHTTAIANVAAGNRENPPRP